MDTEFMLTTFDNPFDPFTQFDDWFLFDVEKGYYSCSRLARFVDLSDDLSDVEVNEQIEKAIDTIISIDFLNMYKKVSRNKVESVQDTSEK